MKATITLLLMLAVRWRFELGAATVPRRPLADLLAKHLPCSPSAGVKRPATEHLESLPVIGGLLRARFRWCFERHGLHQPRVLSQHDAVAFLVRLLGPSVCKHMSDLYEFKSQGNWCLRCSKVASACRWKHSTCVGHRTGRVGRVSIPDRPRKMVPWKSTASICH